MKEMNIINIIKLLWICSFFIYFNFCTINDKNVNKNNVDTFKIQKKISNKMTDIKKYDSILNSNPNNIKILIKRASTLYFLKEYDLSNKDYFRCISLGYKDSSYIYFNIGDNYSRMHIYKLRETKLDSTPNNEQSIYKDSALFFYKKAFIINPKNKLAKSHFQTLNNW